LKLALTNEGTTRNVLLIAEDRNAESLANEIIKSSKSPLRVAYYNLDGFYGVFDEDGKLARDTLENNGPAEGIAKVIEKTGADEVFIACPVSYYVLVDAMLKLGKNNIRFMASPKSYELCIGWPGRNDGWVMPAVDLDTGGLSPFYRIAKRCLDIFVSLCTLIILSPLLAITALIIKLTSKGPVFYTQMRCGQHGRLFKIYKFRSMRADAEDLLPKLIDFDKLREPVFKIERDPRVTCIGRILRKTSIDELPQLFNVVRGDLTLVGPRPEEIALVKRYNSYFRDRLKVKPGVTGLQQITCRGTTNMMERMRYDLAYIVNQSLWLDLKIMWKTIWVVVTQKRST
jgi:exopolysaccharide biosynthesis polyprenyl glycosylphosphotransferase